MEKLILQYMCKYVCVHLHMYVFFRAHKKTPQIRRDSLEK